MKESNTFKKSLLRRLNIPTVVRHFSLKSNDKIVVFIDNHTAIDTYVIGFYCYGMKIPWGIIPFFCGLFYGAGYHSDGKRFITVKKYWHYYPALVCEWLRLKLPRKMSKAIFLF